MTTEPTVYYICKFPDTYNYQQWWYDKDRAEAFVRHKLEKYGIKGTVKKVVEVEEK